MTFNGPTEPECSISLPFVGGVVKASMVQPPRDTDGHQGREPEQVADGEAESHGALFPDCLMGSKPLRSRSAANLDCSPVVHDVVAGYSMKRFPQGLDLLRSTTNYFHPFVQSEWTKPCHSAVASSSKSPSHSGRLSIESIFGSPRGGEGLVGQFADG